MIPSDNPVLDGCKVVKFTIASVTEGMERGSVRDLTVSVNDDEAPVEASFELEEVRFRENDPSAATIRVELGQAAPAEGVLIIKMQSANKYGVDFTTDPAAVGNKIFLHVPAGETSAAIKVFPVNDVTFKADRNIDFTIIDASGGVLVGIKNSLLFSITDDDGYQLSSIASIRSMYEDEDMIIHSDKYIEGTVTSIDNISSGRIVIDDGTGALQIQLITTHSLTRGDLVLFNLNHGLLHELHKVLEVSQVSEYERLGTGDVRISRMTLEGLYAGGGKLPLQTVQLAGLTFPEANGSLPMLGDRVATDGIRTITVRTNTMASFRNEVVPGGTLNITGIFVNINGTYFLYPQEFSDIRRQLHMLKRE
jgi:hypothetical protein